MALTITDEQLRAMGMSAEEARLEIACRLFDAGKAPFHVAMRLAGVDRPAFEQALGERGIAVYRPTIEDLQEDVEALGRMES